MKSGVFVKVLTGSRVDQIGMVAEGPYWGSCYDVKFGPDGPALYYTANEIRPALADEVDVQLPGVGGLIMDSDGLIYQV